MPLVENKHEQPPHEEPTPIRIASPEYQGVVVDTRYTPQLSLLTHLEGSSWTVDYFSQVLNTDSAIAGQNVTRNPVYEQWRLIERFELKVSAPLTATQDEATKTMSVTGSATVYPMVIPNEGDMFTATIADGRRGIFQVTKSERRSIFKETAHVIDYVLIDYATPERLINLTSKVIVKYYFVKDFLDYGQNPLILEEEFVRLKGFKNDYQKISTKYFQSFISNEFSTLIIPNQELSIYDHFLTKAMLAISNTFETPDVQKVKLLNISGDKVMEASTIWDALINCDRDIFKVAFRQVAAVSALSFEFNPMMESIFHSGIKLVVYPADDYVNVGYLTVKRYKPLCGIALLDLASGVKNLSDLIVSTELDNFCAPSTPVINPINKDGYYVFSEAFYQQTEGQSLLELCLQDYLDRKAINTNAIWKLCRTYNSWSTLEKYYYALPLLILIKACIRSI